MTKLNATAANQWASYIGEVRSALSALNQDQIEEIIDDLETHFEDEETLLTESGQQIGEAEIAAVISRLGDPAAIAEAYGIEPPNPSAIDSVSMGLLLTSFLLIATAGIFPVMLIILAPLSAILARIALVQPDVAQSTYRWAAYPGLVTAYFMVVLLILFWTLIPVLPLAASGGILPQILVEENATFQPGSMAYWVRVWSVAFIATGIWWLVLNRILRNRRSMLEQVFHPFLPITNIFANKILISFGLLQIILAIIVILTY